MAAARALARGEAADAAPVRIALVGKYVQLEDAYLSVVEALRHSGFQHGCGVEIDWVDSETLDDARGPRAALEDADGILIPGGFGVRGIEGKIAAVADRARARRSRSWACAWACRWRSPTSRATSSAWTARTRPSSTPRRRTR